MNVFRIFLFTHYRKLLVSLGSGLIIVFSPLSYADTFTLAPELANPKQLTTGVDSSYWPRISPDGKQVLYYSKVHGLRQLFVQDIDSGKPVQLTSGSSDNRDPSWSADGSLIVWSAKPTGGNYDIWIMHADGSGKIKLTSSKINEMHPRLSPITFRLTPEGSEPVDPMFGGIEGPTFGPYYRVLYQKGLGKTASVWSMWDDGRFQRQVSPEGMRAQHAEWAPDGMAIAYDVETSNGSVIYLGKSTKSTTVHPYVERKSQLSDEQLLQKLPKEFVTYPARPITDPRDNFSRPAFFANNTGLLVVKTNREKANSYNIYYVDLISHSSKAAVTNDGVAFAPAMSPRGDKVAFTAFVKGDISQVFVADSKYYLSEALNLYRYPEIIKQPSEKLAKNRFVIQPNSEAEFFHLLEKVRYEKKGVFVSTDPLMQLYHDLFEAILKNVEKGHLYSDLTSVTEAMYRFALRQYGISKGNQKEKWGRLAVYFSVPYSILKNEGKGVAKVTLPPALLKQWGEYVGNIENHNGRKDGIDFTQFKVRGHYDDHGKLSAYFRAMIWYGTVPVGDAGDYGSVYKHLSNTGQIKKWNKIYTVTSYFSGEAEDPSFADLEKAVSENPALKNLPASQLVNSVFKGKGNNRIADSAVKTALVNGKGKEGFKKKYKFMPQRYSLDADMLQSVVAPKVPGRGMASSLDIFSAFGSDRALDHLYHVKSGEPGRVDDKAKHRAAINELRGMVKSKAPEYWQKNLYNGWLYAINLLQQPASVPAEISNGQLPQFASSPAWNDKQLITAASSYTELKHDSILYSKQPYAAEGAEGGEVMFFLESAIEKEPKGYVEPDIALYRWLQKLTKQTKALIKKSGYGKSESDYYDQVDNVLDSAADLLAELEGLSAKELSGASLSDKDYQRIDRFGAKLEAYYVEAAYGGAGGLMTRGGDRLENGIKLVADVLTSFNSGEVLEEAVGNVYNLYVITPHADGLYLNQGGVFSYYEFTQPIAERLTDREWAVKAASRPAPSMPSWTNAIVDTR